MPREKNKLARIVVPLAGIVLAGMVVVAVGINSGRRPSAPPPGGPPSSAVTPPASLPTVAATVAPDAAEAPAAPTIDPTPSAGFPEPRTESPPGSAAESDEASEAQANTSADEAPGDSTPFVSVRPRIVELNAPLTPIGSVDPAGDFRMMVEFTPAGAGVEAITLAQYYSSVERVEHYSVQRRTTRPSFAGPDIAVVSLAARAAILNGQIVDLYSTTSGPIWREIEPGAFEAIIENENGVPVARILKHYDLQPNSYDLRISQSFENLTDDSLAVEWVQYGPVDLPGDTHGYGGDARRVRFGFLLSQTRDPSQQIIETERRIRRRSGALDKPLDEFGRLWPTENAILEGQSLVWAAMTNRYFAFVIHPMIDSVLAASAAPIDKRFELAAGRVDRVVVGGNTAGGADDRVLVLQLRSPVLSVGPGEALDLSLSAYTGPKWGDTLRSSPVYTALGMDKLIIYNLGGPCAFCTFQPLARGMLVFLDFVHDFVFHDWALAIMFLVVCVRGVLHPVTKRSQISLQRFSKQMQSLAPKQKKLQEKFKDDPKRLKEEMARLMREEGVNFTGALGCLPMFLQSPVWIALYAMLFFAFDLRQEPAFFGVFQVLSGGRWTFLNDLSAPDAFIQFGAGITFPLMGRINSLNLLPLLLGAVFYVHQKYLTPPSSTALSPEQESQQKMVRIISVVMFPLLMYNAPSGLSIYFITNSALGIVESRYIRSHINKMDLEPKTPAPGRKRVENLRQSVSGLRKPPACSSFKDRKR